MVEFIDYEKRLTCEDHIVLWYYFHIYVDPEKDYRSFRITEELINAYNAPSNRSRREEIFRITERMKKELDVWRARYHERIWEYEKPVIWADRKKTDYYLNQLETSHRFEVYIDYCFRQRGYDIGLYYGKKQQYSQGETKAGIEIKCDRKLRETGNVYIEYQERMTREGVWVDSGILKPDETKYFLIGTEEEFYILPREALYGLYTRVVLQGEYIPGVKKVREKTHGTSKGFIISSQIAGQINLTVEETIQGLTQERR